MGGLGMSQLYTDSLALKIEAMISHVRAGTSLGKSMIINLNWTQLVAGTSTNILESLCPIEYILRNWIMHVHEFLIQIRGTISIKDIWIPQLAIEYDFMLMYRLPAMDFGKTDQRIINNWRMFYQVNSFSDITKNASGNRVEL